MPRVWLFGPRWRRRFDVRRVAVTLPLREGAICRKVLVYDLEPDVRELVTEALRHDVVAMWSDPRERL
jgi:hypothetical protein